MRYLLVLAILTSFCAVGDQVSFGKDQSGYFAVIDGEHQPVFWRKAYTHGENPFLEFHKNGTVVGAFANRADQPYNWGTVTGDHLDLFPARDQSTDVMVGFLLRNLMLIKEIAMATMAQTTGTSMRTVLPRISRLVISGFWM